VPKRLTLYTATNDAPTAVGGIVAQGQGASVRFYRVLEVPHPYAFRGTAKDHFTGEPISSGYGWSCAVEEIRGAERDRLLS
jgi:hypothetical protein